MVTGVMQPDPQAFMLKTGHPVSQRWARPVAATEEAGQQAAAGR